MDHLDGWTVVRMSIEISLGLGIKLLCDNGRIHWKDLANDFLFWLPGFGRPADGLTRQVEELIPEVRHEPLPTALAAK